MINNNNLRSILANNVCIYYVSLLYVEWRNLILNFIFLFFFLIFPTSLLLFPRTGIEFRTFAFTMKRYSAATAALIKFHKISN